MGRLIYSAITSLDGYVADADGNFDWAAPDEEVHAFVNDLERDVGTYLYGRRMYETMRFWETDENLVGGSPVARDFAEIWRSADKVVYSRTLRTVSSARTRLEAVLDPDELRRFKAGAARDLSVGGADLAAQVMRAAVVDEYRLFVTPVVVGGGTRAFPQGLRLDLRLLDQRRFSSGVVYVRYDTVT